MTKRFIYLWCLFMLILVAFVIYQHFFGTPKFVIAIVDPIMTVLTWVIMIVYPIGVILVMIFAKQISKFFSQERR